MTTTANKLMRLKVAAAAAVTAVVVVARAHSPQTNEPQVTKETSGNGYTGRKQVK